MKEMCIFHVDADSFFASVEVSRDPFRLRGKPVCVIAGSGGCILAATYEAKAKGITTGMPYWEAVKKLPEHEGIYIPAHFSYYAQASEQIFHILGQYSSNVEEMSVDEGYLEMTEMQDCAEQIATAIQQRIMQELGLPVSIGIAGTKTLAKMASKKAKPFGIVHVKKEYYKTFLQEMPLAAIPGIGRKLHLRLQAQGICTPLDFLDLSRTMVRATLGQPGVVLWNELQYLPMSTVCAKHAPPKSLSRVRSFPVTEDTHFLQSEVIQHILLCTYKLRKKHLVAKQCTFYLKNHFHHYVSYTYEETIPHHSAFKFLGGMYPDIVRLCHGVKAKAVGIVFSGLSVERGRQTSLFSEDNRVFREETLLRAMDGLNKKHGKCLVTIASSGGPARTYTPWTVEMLKVPHLGKVL